MAALMNHVEFRAALENAIKGKSANKAPFSIAWASGKLSRQHLASWARITTITSDHSRITWHTSTRGCRTLYGCQGLPLGEHVRGRDRRRPSHRSPDPLCRGLRDDGRAGQGPRQHDSHHARFAKLVLFRFHARGSDRRGCCSRGRARVAGAFDLPEANADAAREIQIQR